VLSKGDGEGAANSDDVLDAGAPVTIRERRRMRNGDMTRESDKWTSLTT
jgi:hypothetical protein